MAEIVPHRLDDPAGDVMAEIPLAPGFSRGIRSSPAPSSLSPSNEDYREGGHSGASLGRNARGCMRS